MKLSTNLKSANLSNQQNRSHRKYQRNCAFSFKKKRIAWNKRKDKTMALDTQADLSESDKSPFCKQREWSEFYFGEFINYN